MVSNQKVNATTLRRAVKRESRRVASQNDVDNYLCNEQIEESADEEVSISQVATHTHTKNSSNKPADSIPLLDRLCVFLVIR